MNRAVVAVVRVEDDDSDNANALPTVQQNVDT